MLTKESIEGGIIPGRNPDTVNYEVVYDVFEEVYDALCSGRSSQSLKILTEK